MEVERLGTHPTLDTSAVVSAILNEWGAVTDYRTLRDSLPRRLAHLLQCRCVLLYQRIGETLQFAAGSFDDLAGWSAGLLSIAHINPIDLNSGLPEAHAWRIGHAILNPAGSASSQFVAVPLLYRQRTIGVLVAFRNAQEQPSQNDYRVTDTLPTKQTAHMKVAYWSERDLPVLESVAGVVALLLENTRLLERDRQRIRELSLLNSIASQLHHVGYEPERIYNIVMQRTREISAIDLCALVTPMETVSWISPVLQRLLFEHFSQQRDPLNAPLILERPGDAQTDEYWLHLSANIKTVFALPLVINETTLRTTTKGHGEGCVPLSLYRSVEKGSIQGTKVLGIVVGAYYKAWKLRREEQVLLQVLVSQASAAFENIHLLAEVVEARNEARKLLRRVLDDVAAMQRLEEEKRRLDRLASLGEMAASVAHEVRNPLASIKTSMQMLKDDLEHPTEQLVQEEGGNEMLWVNEDAQESVSIVLKEVERLDAIVRDLLLFAKPRQLHCVVCNLHELSDHVLHVMRQQCAELKVTIQRSYHDVPSVYIDVAQMEQVLFNLYTNALQAMPEGGVLTVSCQIMATEQGTQWQTSHAKGTSLATESEQQCWLEFSVSDTGVGMAPEQLKRIFQPFFTTKAHGIGLGLPITRRLVEDHRGHLFVKSQPGQGATFSVRLPVVEAD